MIDLLDRTPTGIVGENDRQSPIANISMRSRMHYAVDYVPYAKKNCTNESNRIVSLWSMHQIRSTQDYLSSYSITQMYGTIELLD